MTLSTRGMVDVVVADLDGGRRVARADARRAHDADVRHALVLAASSSSASAPASMHDRLSQTRIVTLGGRGSPSADDIEVRVERRHLVDLGHRHAQQFGEPVQVARRQAFFGVLDLVQVFDQQRPLVGPGADQRCDGVDLGLAQHAALRKQRRIAATGARDESAPRRPPPCSLAFAVSSHPTRRVAAWRARSARLIVAWHTTYHMHGCNLSRHRHSAIRS